MRSFHRLSSHPCATTGASSAPSALAAPPSKPPPLAAAAWFSRLLVLSPVGACLQADGRRSRITSGVVGRFRATQGLTRGGSWLTLGLSISGLLAAAPPEATPPTTRRRPPSFLPTPPGTASRPPSTALRRRAASRGGELWGMSGGGPGRLGEFSRHAPLLPQRGTGGKLNELESLFTCAA